MSGGAGGADPGPGVAGATTNPEGMEPGSATQLPQDVAFLKGVSNQGNLLVSLWQDKPSKVIGREIYQYDLGTKALTPLVAPSDPHLTMGDVSLFDSYLLWEEVRPVEEGTGWKLHLRNLKTGDDAVLAQDDLRIPENAPPANVMPHSPSIYGRYVAWSQFTQDGDTFDSNIFLYDIQTKHKRSLAVLRGGGFENTLERPQLFGNSVVWNKVFYDRANRVAHADVYLFDIVTGRERRLTENGKSMAPVISQKYIAWEYRSTPEDVYGQIELYNLENNQLTRLTQAKPHEELFSPTIGSRLITWQSGSADKAQAYDLRSKRLVVLDTGFITGVYTNGGTIAWQWNEPADRINPLDRRIKYVSLPTPIPGGG